jgi:post-segregation antitoxin (ccd killing protein)
MVTDTGDVSDMLDLAERVWPDVHDRKALLLRLAQAGRDAIAGAAAREEATERRERQARAMAESAELIDVDVLLSDAAWQ